MMVSARVRAIKPSATLAVNQRAGELRAAGVDVLSFAAGEPDFDTPEPIKEAAIAGLRAGMTKYAPVPGDPETRRIIAEKLATENRIPGVTADHIVVSCGGKHSLYLLFQVLLDDGAGQEVILPTPAWVSYAPQVLLGGGRVVEVQTTAASGFLMHPDQLRNAITPRTRAVVLNSPSNPCGVMYTPDQIRELAAVVAEAAADVAPGIVLISDELYEKIIFGGIEHLSPGSIDAIADRTITVNGLSKAYAMTGWRIGYAAGTDEFGLAVAAGMKKLQSQSTTSIPTFLMPAVRTALLECGDEVARMRDAFAARAEVMYGLVQQVPGLVCPRPTGAFYVFPDVSAHFGKTSAKGASIASAGDFAKALLDEHHVAVVPGEDFGAGGERCARLSFACGEDQIREGIGRLTEFVRGLA